METSNSRGINNRGSGFTIVELLIVIVVIAILAAITIVSYSGVTSMAKETALKSDLRSAATQLDIANVRSGRYPANADELKKSDGTTFQYSTTADTFCLSALNGNLEGVAYHVSSGGSLQEGLCPGDSANPIQNGATIQTATSENCSSTRTMVVDARDNRTYWIQKLADGECWMLTNLAYAGGGTNTYGDVKTIQNGTGDAAGTYTAAKYYVHANANPTNNPTSPSISTDGGASGAQYGYFYNWCAAMGVQLSTEACSNATTPYANRAVSICPAHWRLPTGGTSGEFRSLNTAINDASTNSDAGFLSAMLGQRGGRWYNGSFVSQGVYGQYWSSFGDGAGTGALFLSHGSSYLASYGAGFNKTGGVAVRCILA